MSQGSGPALDAPPGEPSGSKKLAFSAVNRALPGHVVFAEDRLHRAGRLAGAAVLALIGVGIEHPLALVDALDRALTDARLVLDIKHGSAITWVIAGSAPRRPAGTGGAGRALPDRAAS